MVPEYPHLGEQKYPLQASPAHLANPDQSQVPKVSPEQNPLRSTRECGQPGAGRSPRHSDLVGGDANVPLLFLSHQEDQKEGMTAFVEKRKANFRDQ